MRVAVLLTPYREKVVGIMPDIRPLAQWQSTGK